MKKGTVVEEMRQIQLYVYIFIVQRQVLNASLNQHSI